MIDSHCHLEFEHFDEDRSEVISKSKEKIKAVVDSSADTETLEKVLKLSEKHPNCIFPTLGLHPTKALEKTNEEIKQYFEDIRRVRQKIVGVGEVGLDYHHIRDHSKRKECRQIFEDFITLSDELGLPLVVHSRDSMSDAMETLRKKEGKVVIHCFSGKIDHLE